VGRDLSPRPLLDVQALGVDVSVLKHMLNANLLIVVAILNDQVLQIGEKSALAISLGHLRNT
jgi:hypothetical protein